MKRRSAPIWGGLYVGGHVGGLWNDGGDTSKFKRYKKWWECYGNERSHRQNPVTNGRIGRKSSTSSFPMKMMMSR